MDPADSDVPFSNGFMEKRAIYTVVGHPLKVSGRGTTRQEREESTL